MDFFGNVQNVELQGEHSWNETAWKEDLEQLGKMIDAARNRYNSSTGYDQGADSAGATVQPQPVKREKAAIVAAKDTLTKQVVGAAALLGCLGAWLAASWFESGK
jgi:hypothetical protein